MRNLLSLFLALFLSAMALAQPTPPPPGLEQLRVTSKVLAEDRVILVRLPPGYETGSQRYPVLYLTDGDAHLAHTSATVDFLARNGRMPQLIIVGVTNTDRTRDLTPTRATTNTGEGRVEFPTAGGADRFLDFFQTELIPGIESRYRTQPYRIFAGHSFGAMFALHALATRPELFNAYIAASPTLNWDGQFPLRRLEEFLEKRRALEATLFVTMGSEGRGLDRAFETMRSLLQSKRPAGFVWAAERMADEDHGSTVMPTHYKGLRKIFEGWPPPRDPETHAIIGGWKGVQSHYAKLSKRYGYEIRVPEAVTNRIGYQLLGEKKFKEAIEIFRWNAETYPGSANVYDSLGEAFETSGSLDLARENYAKAVELGKKNSDPNLRVYESNLKRVSFPHKGDG